MLSIATQLTYQHIVLFARQLPLAERVRLVRDILAEPIEETVSQEMTDENTRHERESTRSMLGICADLDISLSSEQIDEAQHEMWMKLYE